MLLDTPVRYLKGVGLRCAEIFGRMGITNIESLLFYFPKRYEDYSNFIPLSKLTPGMLCAVKAKVLASSQRMSWAKRGFSLTAVVFGDSTGKVSAVWFNQPYLKNYFLPGTEAILYGKVELYQGGLQLSSPEFELIKKSEGADSFNQGKLVPVYSLSEGITQRYFRKIIKSALDQFIPSLSDILPYDIRNRHKLINYAKSIISIHFPENDAIQKEAYRRLSFEEFFLYQLPILMRKFKRARKKGIAHRVGGDIFNSFYQDLPFKLTNAQNRVLEQIKHDMAAAFPMQRLLQGEVGSGKTILAILAGAIALDGGYQAAFMVPTEILAKQHYEKIKKSSAKNKKIKISLLTSSLKAADKSKIYKDIKEGKIDLVIGTHSLLGEELKFKNLGLVIIDEQHKFGVGQRALLPQKGNNPDCLIMTATPIPRTLSLTIYGDLDVSVLDELPQGRILVKTLVYSQDSRSKAYEFIRVQINEGRQAYVVCPNIEEHGLMGLSSVESVYEETKARFKEFRVGLLHGKMKYHQQDKVMADFKNGSINILVATTILEVGIDIANASVVLIEDAQVFGLAQLHQLRGRIGRGNYQSYCLLVAQAQGKEAQDRIKVISELSDGFKIAEEDLRIRGPGEFFGRRQHGLTGLKLANPLTQMYLLKAAREEAKTLLRLDLDLVSRQNIGIKHALKKRFPEYEQLLAGG